MQPILYDIFPTRKTSTLKTDEVYVHAFKVVRFSEEQGALCVVDLLLDVLERRKEDCVNDAGTGHGNAEAWGMISNGVLEVGTLRVHFFHSLVNLTSVHFPFEKLNTRQRDMLPFSSGQTIPLVVGFCRVNWIDLNSLVFLIEPWSHLSS